MTGRLQTTVGPLVLGDPPSIVGILNLTPDSFSDGGRFVDPDLAVDHALKMEDDGASVIDVGGCSTRPGSRAPSAEEELRRTLPVIERLADRLEIPISIDTWRAKVFREAFDRGATILNDVTSLEGDEDMAPALAETGAIAILMHMRGAPETMQGEPRYDDVVGEIVSYFGKVLAAAAGFGVRCDRVVLDPGIGFGKTLAHNLAILRRLDELHGLGRPLLLGASRKSFLGKILDRSDPLDREFATAATTAHLFNAGVQFIRVHDVRATQDVLTVLRAIESSTDLREQE